ncbi:MAG TPA: TlpA disulfide reductase family protein [Burkholderiales bacterium]|jgi:thiol-disulfide isomerase/thioredoxin|nr:TlpA disulfide reductase family protein [Burkholderiales bacterium]
MRRREALILGAVGLGAAALGAVLAPVTLQRRRGEAALASARFSDLAGNTRLLADWHAPALVCNFWATWCEPCREEIPLLIGIRQKYGQNRVEVVGIGIDHADKMQQFANQYRIPYPLLSGQAGGPELMGELGNDAGALPFTIVRDMKGAIRYRHLGRLREGQLEPVLEGILQ